MLGYYQNPEATAQSIREGWFYTGDLGFVQASGAVTISGRRKELIIRAGLNVYPSDVDAVLLGHPEVAEAYAVGLPDPTLGEKVGACVVKKEHSNLTEPELIQFCKTKLAAYKCPESVRFVESVPKTSRGKVNRANLRTLFG